MLSPGRIVRPLAALLLVHILGCSSTRPTLSVDDVVLAIGGQEGEEDGASPELHSEREAQQPAAPTAAAFTSAAISRGVSTMTGLPVWALRVAAWPIASHPVVAFSMAAFDAAASSISNGAGLGIDEQYVGFLGIGEDPGPVADAVPESPKDKWGNCDHVFCGFGWFNPKVLYAAEALVVLTALAAAAFGYLHKMQVTDNRPPFPADVPAELSMRDTGDFTAELFDFEACDANAFLYALFCPCVRHADTLQATGQMRFWIVFGSWMMVEVLAMFVFTYYVMLDHDATAPMLLRGLALAAMFVPKRQLMRKKFGAKDRGDFVLDCTAWVLCNPCVVAQEARQVDSVTGVRVLCPFTFAYTKDSVVGEPVSAEAGGAASDAQEAS